MNLLVFTLVLAYAIYSVLCLGMVKKRRKKIQPKELYEAFKTLVPAKPKTVKQIINIVDGKNKKTYLRRNQDEARIALEKSGNSAKYAKTILFSRILAAIGFAFSILIGNLLIAPVLSAGLYFVPLWATKLYVYRYDRFVREELQTTLSLITSSYIRHNDLQKAVEENLEYTKGVVHTAFKQFVWNLEYVSSDILEQIEVLSAKIDNKIFHKWCETIALCQSDHTLKATLTPIVSKFSDIKGQQSENDTNMMLPIKNTAIMVAFALSPYGVTYIINLSWFDGIINSIPGQICSALTILCIFFTINKAISLCEPIMFDV